MNDDLVNRLRTQNSMLGYYDAPNIQKEAADRIEAQAARVEAAETRSKDHWQQLQRLRLLAHGRDPDKGERLPMCRDCADFDGRCQGDGLPCDPQAAAEEMIRRKWADVTRAEALEAALRVAAGYISTKEGHTDQHPQDVYDWIVSAALAGEKKDE